MEAKRRNTLTRLSSCIVLCLSLALVCLRLASFAAGDGDAQLDVVTFTLNQAVELALAANPEVLSVREKTVEFCPGGA